MRIFNSNLLALFLKVFYLMIVVESWKWEYHPLSSSLCDNCGTKQNWFCSNEFGYLPKNPAFNSYLINQHNNSCVVFNQERSVVTKEQVLEKLGNNAAITFIGDSNCRKMFQATLEYFDQDDWLEKLKELSIRWKEKDVRKKVDHTYLCPSPSFKNHNLTIAFLWSRFFMETSFLYKRPWGHCKGICRLQEGGATSCDGSSAEGASDRWECGTRLNSLNSDSTYSKQIVTVSHGGVHDVIHVIRAHLLNFSDEKAWKSPINYIETFYNNSMYIPPEWEKDFLPPKDSKYCWKNSASNKGDKIHLTNTYSI